MITPESTAPQKDSITSLYVAREDAISNVIVSMTLSSRMSSRTDLERRTQNECSVPSSATVLSVVSYIFSPLNIRSRTVWMILALLLSLNERGAIAAPNAAVLQKPPASQKVLSIDIQASRSQPTAGTGLGFEAEIQNLSEAPVYLREQKVILTVPPEVFGPFSQLTNRWAFFPTEHTFPQDKKDPEPYDGTIMIQPGATYRVGWSIGPEEPVPEQSAMFSGLLGLKAVTKSELNFLFFSPGQYKVSVVAEYWTDPKSQIYGTATQTATVEITSPESVILVGAAVGGLICFALFPSRRQLAVRAASSSWRYFNFLRPFLTFALGAAGAMLLSSMVTILLARLSGTEFLIHISVRDFWGAIAVGFVANYAGARFLDKLVPPTNDNKPVPDSGAPKDPVTTNPPAKNQEAS